MKHNLDLEADLQGLIKADLVTRIWAKDHTAWSPQPDEIVNRLGWLDLLDPPITADSKAEKLAVHIEREGILDLVLLGMGGSSLGAEALRASFPDTSPRLHVLDSTHPDWVQSVLTAIEPASTIVLVASKSGTTAEVKALAELFWGHFGRALPPEALADHFVAITDPGSPLAELAAHKSFLATLLNPADIGGRFSVLSRFGMVAARAIGIDTVKLLESASEMALRCRQPTAENPGLLLGTALGSSARHGRDHMTLLTSPSIETFGLWVEQLIAESTGKSGHGILPIVSEPLSPPSAKRLFVVLRLAGDDNNELDDRVRSLAERHAPLVELEIADLYGIGGELFRWQFATAVAAHILGVQPFDQPDVQATKKVTTEALERYAKEGSLPAVEASSNLAGALREAPCTYLALMAFCTRDQELESVVADLRRTLARDPRHPHLSTTFGYGPRFLHSTGQLHKGGPRGGLFVQLVARPEHDFELPGRDYSLGLLLQAQADGDLSALGSRGRRCVRIAGERRNIISRLRAVQREISNFSQPSASP